MWPASRVDLWPYPTVVMLVILAIFACLYRGRIHRAARKLANTIKGPAATAPPRRDLLGASSSSAGISSNGVIQRETSAVSESSLSNQPTQRESSTASESGPSIQPIQRDTSAASEAGLSIQPCTLQVAPGSLVDKKNFIAAQFGWNVSKSMPKVASEAAHDLGIATGSKSLAELINEVHAKLASVY